MNRSDRQKRIEEIFHKACDISEDDLDKYLAAACENDSEIRREVRILLVADKAAVSEEFVLPEPPLREFFKEMQEAVEDLDSRALDETKAPPGECEQCGTKLDLSGGENPVVCKKCGGVTRTIAPFENQQYTSQSKLPSRYRVEKVIGEGSYGIVVKAWDSLLERDVAIKIPKGKFVSKKLFVREARIASKLRDKNIVKIHDVNDKEDFAFIVSDYIDGTSLNRWRRGRECVDSRSLPNVYYARIGNGKRSSTRRCAPGSKTK